MRIFIHYLLWQMRFAKAWTFYGEEACSAIEKYAAGKQCLVEIGCWQGVNTCRIRRVMNPEGLFYAVDPYTPGRFGVNWNELIARYDVQKISTGEVHWLKMTDLEAAKYFSDQNKRDFDFIYSDCLNTYEGSRNTWNAWSPLLRQGGIYIVTNSHPDPDKHFYEAESIQYTQNEILNDPRFRLLETVETFTILERI